MKTTKHAIKFRLLDKGKELIYLTADIKGDFKKLSSPFAITVCPPTVWQAMESFFGQVIKDPSNAKYLAELEQSLECDALLPEKVLHLAVNSSIDYDHDKNWRAKKKKYENGRGEMAREKAAIGEALSKQKAKASKEGRSSFLDLIILLPVLAFIFFSITHPIWYSTYITEPLFGPLIKSLGAWLKA